MKRVKMNTNEKIVVLPEWVEGKVVRVVAVRDPNSYEGWESVAMVDYDHIPEYEEMVKLKDQYWEKDEVVFQVHPARSEYVNDLENMLHLWRYMLIAPRIEKNLRRKVLEAYEQAKRLYHNDEKREFLVPGEQKILAVSGITRWPTWEEVCETKQRYWEPEEVAVQFNLSSDEDLNEEHIILLWDASDMLLPSKEIV